MASKAQTIDKVVEQARRQYELLMDSQYVSNRMRIDGQETRGQIEDNQRMVTTEEKNTKTVTCMLDATCKRGSFVEIQKSPEDTEYSLKGIVMTEPNRTPVDYYFSVLLFNASATRQRQQIEYDDNGYIISDNPTVVDDILCFVNRVGMRERQMDAGIDRDSVNEVITTTKYDIQIDDLLLIGHDKYKVTDIKELDKDIFHGYITYYRE